MASLTPFSSNLFATALVVVLSLWTVHASTELEVAVTGIISKDVKLKCDLPRSNPPKVRWTDYVYNTNRDPVLIYDSTLGVVNSGHSNMDNFEVDPATLELTMKGVNLDSPGQYFCESEVNATHTLKKTFDLTVCSLPQCQGESSLKDGGIVDLTCQTELSGNDMPSLEWFQGSTAIESQDEAMIQMMKKRVRKDASWDMDKAVMTCRMSFGDMVEECSITLDVKYRVRNLRFEPEQDSYRVGQEVRCEASGNPAPKITLLPELAQKSGDGYKSLIVDPEWEGTQAELFCRASNSLDGKTEILSKNITFQVLEGEKTPPPRPTEPSKPVKGDANTAAGTSTAAIIAGIIIGALVR